MKKTTDIAKSVVAAIAASALVFGLAGCAPKAQESEPEQETTPAPIGIKLDITADGWNADTSTPVIAMLTEIPDYDHTSYTFEGGEVFTTVDEADAFIEQATSANPEAVPACTVEYRNADDGVIEAKDESTYVELAANEEQEIEIDAGTYELLLISPVNANGSIYTVPDGTLATSDEITDEVDAITLELIPAEQVAAEQMEAVITAITVASTADPEAVPATTLERATTNASACPNVAVEELEAATVAAEEAVQSGDKAAAAGAVKGAVSSAPKSQGGSASAAPSVPGTTGSASNGTLAANASKPSGSTGGSGGSTGGSTGGSSTPAPAPSAPSHEHNWVAQTTQKYVVDVPASEKYSCSCGKVFDSYNKWGAHSEAAGWGESHSYAPIVTKEQGHYETVTTGYTCSCGATK